MRALTEWPGNDNLTVTLFSLVMFSLVITCLHSNAFLVTDNVRYDPDDLNLIYLVFLGFNNFPLSVIIKNGVVALRDEQTCKVIKSSK